MLSRLTTQHCPSFPSPFFPVQHAMTEKKRIITFITFVEFMIIVHTLYFLASMESISISPYVSKI